MKQIALLILFVCLSLAGFAQCDAPANLSVSQNNGDVTFTWNAAPAGIRYHVQFKYPGYDWTYPEYEDSTVTNTLVLTGVLPSVMIDWRVKTVCTNGVSAYTAAPATLTVTCPQPVNLTATAITISSAALNWTHAPNVLNDYPVVYLAYRVAGQNGSWISRGQVSGGVFSLTGLQPGTTYEWCVNQSCPYFNSSPAIGTFTTLSLPCGTASLYLPTSLTTTSATLRWYRVPDAISYTIDYKANNATNWITQTTSTTALPITTLTPSTSYQWRVLATCPTNVGVYSGIGAFTTATVPPPANTCGTPANVVVSNLGNTKATVSWGGVPNATSYQYWYKLTSGTTWIGVTANNGTSHTKTNYAKNTSYQYRVRAVCPSGMSAYSPEGSFTTFNSASARLASEVSAEDATNELTLFPNPTDGEFFVRMPTTSSARTYQVMNSAGLLIRNGFVDASEFYIDIRSQTSGLYVLRVMTEDGRSLFRKFVKK